MEMTDPKSVARRACLAVLLAVFCFQGAPAQKMPFTLAQVMSSPFPSALSAAPAGGLVAWVQDAQGVRNIWVAGPPGYQGRQLTRYSADDGQELDQIEWSPDSKTIVYTRGGAPNRQGENPNPTSDPAGAEQAIWRIGIEGGDPVRVGPGSSPAVSPQGNGLVFIRHGQIFWAPLDGSAEPSQLIHARGNAGSLRWSPEGAKLAFVSSRGDHSFIGMYQVAAKSLDYLDPSVDRDVEPAWSPDGKRLAFLRIPAESEQIIFHPVRTARPWSLVVADLEGKRSQVVWRAEEGPGSAFNEVVAANQILWAADDRLVFPWERDGWIHLYSVPARGGQATLLSPGDFEVEYVTLSPDRKTVLFNSNQNDIDRRHLWRVSPAGGPPVPVTQGAGIEWEPTYASDSQTLAFFRSDARRPARASVLAGAGEARDMAASSIPQDFPERGLVEPQAVIFPAADGMQIHGQLFLPPSRAEGTRHPAVLFFHGGSRRQMLLGWHYGSYYHNAYAMNQYLASRGYLVLAVNYRSGVGYGMEFREALNYGAAGASEFYDVLGAGIYMRGRSDVDSRQIGLWGGSYGGYLTAMGLSRASDLFAAGVDLHGVHDWNAGIRNFVPSYNKLELPEAARKAFEASPMASVDTWRSPVLVIHGDDDRNVPFSETVNLVEALRARKVDAEQLIFPDEVHSFLLHRHWVAAYTAAADFFDRRLRKQ